MSKIKVSAGLVPWEVPLLGLSMAVLPPPSHPACPYVCLCPELHIFRGNQSDWISTQPDDLMTSFQTCLLVPSHPEVLAVKGPYEVPYVC